jgi:hypothetical protein
MVSVVAVAGTVNAVTVGGEVSGPLNTVINVVDTVQLEVTAPVVKTFPLKEPPQVLDT